MTTPTIEPQDFAAVKGHNSDNIFKALEFSIWGAFRTKGVNVAEIDEVWDGTGLLIPPHFQPFGLTTKADGATWNREIETADVESHGYAQPTRRDITKDLRSLDITAQETKRFTQELSEQQRIVAKISATNSVRFDASARPETIELEVLALAKDGVGADALYCARWLPLAPTRPSGEAKWVEGDEWGHPYTIDAMVDDVVGTAMRTWWFGSRARLLDMGFEAEGGGGVAAP